MESTGGGRGVSRGGLPLRPRRKNLQQQATTGEYTAVVIVGGVERPEEKCYGGRYDLVLCVFCYCAAAPAAAEEQGEQQQYMYVKRSLKPALGPR